MAAKRSVRPVGVSLRDNGWVDAGYGVRGDAAAMVLLALLMIAAGIAGYVLPDNTFASYGSEALDARIESECGGPPSPEVLNCTQRLINEERRADRLRRSPFLLLCMGGVALLVVTVRTSFGKRSGEPRPARQAQ